VNRSFQIALATASAGAIFALCTAAVAQGSQPAASGGRIQLVSRCESVKGAGICGTFTDVNGAVIPGVSIILRNTGDQTVSSQASDTRGDFAFEDLKSGTYELTAEMRHFKKLIVKNIDVADKRVTELNLTLDTNGHIVTMGIISELPMIDIRSSGITTIINPRQIEALPRRP
jgi:hypothetical protein